MLGRFFALIGVIGMAFTLAGGPALAKGGEKALKLLKKAGKKSSSLQAAGTPKIQKASQSRIVTPNPNQPLRLRRLISAGPMLQTPGMYFSFVSTAKLLPN